MAVIDDSELAELEREFGPKLDENVAYIVREGEPVKSGLGKTLPPEVVIGPFGCRVTYISNQNVRERVLGGQISTEGDYLLSLPAGTVTYNSDIVRVTALPWQPTKRYVKGARIVPTDNSNHVLVCIKTGITGAEEPNWPAVKDEGSVILEGTVEWQNMGKGEDYQIIQVAGPTTYGDKIAHRLICSLKQEVKKPKV